MKCMLLIVKPPCSFLKGLSLLLDLLAQIFCLSAPVSFGRWSGQTVESVESTKVQHVRRQDPCINFTSK